MLLGRPSVEEFEAKTETMVHSRAQEGGGTGDCCLAAQEPLFLPTAINTVIGSSEKLMWKGARSTEIDGNPTSVRTLVARLSLTPNPSP
jgi:hypothetical protein